MDSKTVLLVALILSCSILVLSLSDDNVDPCQDDPCVDGQKCKVNGQSYECQEQNCTMVERIRSELMVEIVCVCEEGFRVHSDRSCSDIDECHENNPCNENSVCSNSRGSYNCTCKPGFERQDKNNCVDINECTTDLHNCTSGFICNNTIGSFICECPIGYKLNDDGTCVDIDECATATCPGLLHCINDPGSYHCGCREGYQKSYRDYYHYRQCNEDCYECRDIDECSHPRTECNDPGMTCTNTVGGFTCGCKNGWSMKNETCVRKQCQGLKNRDGDCYCPSGFKMNTTNEDVDECQDIDECSESQQTCRNHRNNDIGYCINTFGGYHCIYDVSCPTGYIPHPDNEYWCTYSNLVTGLCRLRPSHCRKGFAGALSILHSFVVIDPYVKIEEPLFTISGVNDTSNFEFRIGDGPSKELFALDGPKLMLLEPLDALRDVNVTIDVMNKVPFVGVIHTSIVHVYVRGPDFGLMPEITPFMDPSTFVAPELRHLSG